MAKSIPVYGQISGCTIYRCDENFQPAGSPAARDVTISLPQPTFPTSPIPQMGSFDVPDQTRVEGMTATVTVPNSRDSAALFGRGYVRWLVRYVRDVSEPSGLVHPVGFTIWLGGVITSPMPSISVSPGSEATGDISMSVSKMRVLEGADYVHCDIDRAAGKLVINGVDLRSDVEQIL